MKLTFTHAGQTRTLTKHPAIQGALDRHAITPDQAAYKAWYLRFKVDGRVRSFKLPAGPKDAIRAAKDILNGASTNPTLFSQWVQQEQQRHGITLGQLAKEWIAADLPFSKTKPRTSTAAATIKATLLRALAYWEGVPATTVTTSRHEDFVAWRQQHRARGTGERSADLELSALSSLCQWAVLTGRLKVNPFATRATFATVKQHCHQACPDNDETLHRVLGWLFESPEPEHRLAGGWLAYCALTGQRPGEPIALLKLPPLDKTPTNTKELPFGTIFPAPDGTLRIKAMRLKRGQNPFITLHPALNAFLAAWRAFHARAYRDEKKLFPGLLEQTALNRALNAASKALDLPHYKPHGFGRAYYVKVRRSQGADDATIAGELGQTTNGALIRQVYGDPQDMLGGQLHDWLPQPNTVPVAWDLLAGVHDTFLIHPKRPKIHQDSPLLTQGTGTETGVVQSTETVVSEGETAVSA